MVARRHAGVSADGSARVDDFGTAFSPQISARFHREATNFHILRLVRKQNGFCAICKEYLPDALDGIHVDHIEPLARGGYALKCAISARRAQASAIITRRAETAPAGSVRRSRIERDPERGTPTKFVLASSSSNGTRITATRITPSDRHRAARRWIARCGAGNGRAAGSVRSAPRCTRDVAAGGRPPVPCGQRRAACSASRGRARRSGAPWRPLTGFRRRTAATRRGTADEERPGMRRHASGRNGARQRGSGGGGRRGSLG